MDNDGPQLERLSQGECLRLLGSVPVGRIVYTRQALPAVELVNFTLADGDIVFRTDDGGKLGTAIRGAVVAFEADSLDFDQRTGWSVTVVGQCLAVTDAQELKRLRGIGLLPWAPGEREHYVRIPPTLVTGQRLASQQLEVPGHARRIG